MTVGSYVCNHMLLGACPWPLQVQNLSSKVQQLERELKAARKGGRKLDNVQQQLKQEQAEKQDLALKLLLMERQLQTTKEQLAAGQVGAG